MDPFGLDEFETWGKTTPFSLIVLLNYHGCVMLLHSLEAKTDMEARARVIGAARALAELGTTIRGKMGMKPVHGSLLFMVSMHH